MQNENRNNNLLIAITGLVVCSLFTAVYTAYTTGYVLDSLESSNTMCLLITDTGIKSDDAQLEHQLSQATVALRTAQDFGYALAVGTLGVLVAVLVRIKRQNAS